MRSLCEQREDLSPARSAAPEAEQRALAVALGVGLLVVEAGADGLRTPVNDRRWDRSITVDRHDCCELRPLVHAVAVDAAASTWNVLGVDVELLHVELVLAGGVGGAHPRPAYGTAIPGFERTPLAHGGAWLTSTGLRSALPGAPPPNG